MFVTPFLGLLDTFHHGRLATYSVRHGEKVFDNYENGSEITFHEAWSTFKIDNPAAFLSFPRDVALAMMPIILLSHIFLSALILKLSMNGQASISQLVLQGLHTFISPPLHFDWEFYYRLKCGNTSVRDSWKRFCESRSDMNQFFILMPIFCRSQKVLLAHILLATLENMLLLLPLIFLKKDIENVSVRTTLLYYTLKGFTGTALQRTSLMEGWFTPLEEEILSKSR